MREFREYSAPGVAADASLTLPFLRRQRSRQRVRLDNNEEAGLYLERGAVLRNGDKLISADGYVLEIKLATETVSTISCDLAQELAQICYHLGNRHVNIQIGDGWVRYLQDHVLDAMVRNLGYKVISEQVPFEPLPGAYQAGYGDHGG